jgi:hypothetical protein
MMQLTQSLWLRFTAATAVDSDSHTFVIIRTLHDPQGSPTGFTHRVHPQGSIARVCLATVWMIGADEIAE